MLNTINEDGLAADAGVDKPGTSLPLYQSHISKIAAGFISSLGNAAERAMSVTAVCEYCN